MARRAQQPQGEIQCLTGGFPTQRAHRPRDSASDPPEDRGLPAVATRCCEGPLHPALVPPRHRHARRRLTPLLMRYRLRK